MFIDARQKLPGWELWIYIDRETVPQTFKWVVTTIESLAWCRIIDRDATWPRFKPLCMPEIPTVLVMDLDHIITDKHIKYVHEWMKSGRTWLLRPPGVENYPMQITAVDSFVGANASRSHGWLGLELHDYVIQPFNL